MQRERARWQESAQHQTTAWALRAMRTPVHRPAEAAGGLLISSPGLSRLEMRWKCLQCLAGSMLSVGVGAEAGFRFAFSEA